MYLKVRLRSLDSPKNYEAELLIRHPIIVMICFWTSGLITWAPIVFYFGLDEYTLDVRSDSGLVKSIINCKRVILNMKKPYFGMSIYVIFYFLIIILN